MEDFFSEVTSSSLRVQLGASHGSGPRFNSLCKERPAFSSIFFERSCPIANHKEWWCEGCILSLCVENCSHGYTCHRHTSLVVFEMAVSQQLFDVKLVSTLKF